MELWNRAMTAVVCLLSGLLIVVLGLAFFASDKLPRLRQHASDTTETKLSPRMLSPQASDAIALRAMELVKAKASIRQLEAELEERTKSQRGLQQRLANMETSYQQMRSERDESLNWLLELLAQPAMEEPAETASESASTATSEQPSTTNAAELNDNELAQLNQALQIEELRSQLVELDAALAASQIQAASELRAARADRERAEEAVTRALLLIGPPAVPALVEALEDQQADVRLWAARTLRAFGEQAEPATAALTLALADPDFRVRAEAAQALEAIHD
jgi:Tfp pilus assembly protein PilO